MSTCQVNFGVFATALRETHIAMTQTHTKTATKIATQSTAAKETVLDAELEALVAHYVARDAKEAKREAAEQKRCMAAFEAGTHLHTLQPLELYDPIDRRTVRIPTGQRLHVATHEGNVLIGELTDNTHSLGVLYEEEHRWYQRKYFLPLGFLVDDSRIRIAPQTRNNPDQQAPTKGLELEGEEPHTAVAIRNLETLSLRDEVAFLPRGVRIVLRQGATATDIATRESVELAPNTEAEVVEAVGDITDLEGDLPAIQILVGKRQLALPFEVLVELDPERDVLTLQEQETLQRAEMSRRRFFRIALGTGFGITALVLDGAWYTTQRPALPPSSARDEPKSLQTHNARNERVKHQVFSALYPESASLYGYFTSGGQYWWKLQGALMDLRAKNCRPSVEALAQIFDRVAPLSSHLYSLYRDAYYRSVHTGWREHKHYKTDDDGNRHYTHSTWSKVHSTMWVEPAGLRGKNVVLQGWSEADDYRQLRAKKLLHHPLFALLDADPEHPERSFQMKRETLSFGRDAALSMVTMALFTLPPSFYDELAAWISGAELGPAAIHLGPSSGFPYQKEALLLAGMGAGVVMSQWYQRDLRRTMSHNKYELGKTLEEEIQRIPKLDLNRASTEYFGLAPLKIHQSIRARTPVLSQMKGSMQGFRYTYGSGRDHGRSLDSIYVDPSNLKEHLPEIQRHWEPLASELHHYFQHEQHPHKLLPVLQNALGTETVEAQIQEDRGEATSSSWKRSAWLALPMWGAALADFVLKRA